MKALRTSAKGLATSIPTGEAALEDVDAAELPVLDALEPDSEVVVAVADVFRLAWLIVVFLCKAVPVAAELAPLAPVPRGTNAVVVAFLAAVKLETVELMEAMAACRDVADADPELVTVETRSRDVDAGVLEPPLKENIPE